MWTTPTSNGMTTLRWRPQLMTLHNGASMPGWLLHVARQHSTARAGKQSVQHVCAGTTTGGVEAHDTQCKEASMPA